MHESNRKQIADVFAALPEGCKYAVATASELKTFESEFGAIPDDFRWFLMQCGAGTIGSAWVDGMNELADKNRKFTAKSEIENGWTIEGVFVVGWDGAGSLFGIEAATGRLLVGDHNFGGIHEMAPSFKTFLEGELLLQK